MSSTVIVSCPAGRVTGVADGADGELHRFHSIPYSVIPGDYENAERAPEGQVIDATVPRPESIALSITTPAGTTDLSDLPVIAYIHGGRFEYGTHADPRADGAANARRGVITVQIGYRVGLPGLARFHDDEPHRYRAIDDCQIALEWIQNNIESFGGDPTNVTLVGQSAGATAALWLSRRDHYRGAFRRVLAASPCFPRQTYEQRKAVLRMSLTKPLTRRHLPKVRPAQLKRAYNRFRTFHILDMALGPSPLEPRQLSDIDIVVTSTRDEFYNMPIGRRIDNAGFGAAGVRVMARAMGLQGSVPRWLEGAREIDPDRLAGRFIGDASNRRWVSEVAEGAKGRVWMAEFAEHRHDALHCRELRPLFGVTGDGRLNEWLTDFARTGEVGWPEYTRENRVAKRIWLDEPWAELVDDPLAYIRESFKPISGAGFRPAARRPSRD